MGEAESRTHDRVTAQGVIELHGGTVRAHGGGIGRGALFTLTLPLARHGSSSQESEG